MNVIKTKLKDCMIIEPKVFGDERGFFLETFQLDRYAELVGITVPFVQDNHSFSIKGVIRGLHFQKPPHAQTKLVRCISGKILDVVVDLRKNSKTFGESFSVELSSENNKQLFIPKGFAHGFQVLSNEAIVNYKVDEYHNPDADSGIIWNDNDLLIEWDNDIQPILSKKDLKLN